MCVCVCVCVRPAVSWAERPCRVVVLRNDDASMPSSLPAPQLPHKPFGYPPSLSLSLSHTLSLSALSPSLSLSLSPPRLCKQSAKYFITSLLNRAETLQRAPHYLLLTQSASCARVPLDPSIFEKYWFDGFARPPLTVRRRGLQLGD